MVTQIQNTDQFKPRVVTLSETPLISSILPTLGVGDVLSFFVQTTDEQGRGTLAFRGQTFPAALPRELRPGDTISAQVTELGDAVVLKLLERKPGELLGVRVTDLASRTPPQKEHVQLRGGTTPVSPHPAALDPASAEFSLGPLPYPNTPEFARILRDFTDLLRAANAPLVPRVSHERIEFPQAVQGALRETLSHVASNGGVLSEERFSNVEGLESALRAVTTGQALPELRELVKGLYRALPEAALAPEERFFSALKEELKQLLNLLTPGEEGPLTRIERLLQALARELRNTRTPTVRDKELLQQLIETLRSAKEEPSELRSRINEAMNVLPSAEELKPADDNRWRGIVGQLRNVAYALDQIVARHELLAQLNPLMQFLGEPAMVFLPFLFSHSLAQGGMVLHPWDRVKRDANRRKREKENVQFQRVQLSVPMPSLGRIDIDLAHRPGELLLRLMVEDSDVGEFLLAELEHLTTVLRENGYEKAEVVAGVGSNEFEIPAWVMALDPHTDIIA